MEAAGSSRGVPPTGAAPGGLPVGVADHGFLARLSNERIAELIQSAHSVSYPTGSTVLTPVRAGLALIVSGALRYYLSAADGRQLTVIWAPEMCSALCRSKPPRSSTSRSSPPRS